MKESRFVELLNLYVDHELTQGEAAELDAELQRNPARRETLREYRALQRGCERLLRRIVRWLRAPPRRFGPCVGFAPTMHGRIDRGGPGGPGLPEPAPRPGSPSWWQ